MIEEAIVLTSAWEGDRIGDGNSFTCNLFSWTTAPSIELSSLWFLLLFPLPPFDSRPRDAQMPRQTMELSPGGKTAEPHNPYQQCLSEKHGEVPWMLFPTSFKG
ncbi:hypothetical protein [Tardibacter chloracetimidivorans]|uniref:hypothetical protein n=1 Tax=Tardibacter chloracetimidivorans TaxID=1921510 RepID=UPI0013902370|nr:hypothetical protein [Tardibacter chloracetimidivorans]